MNLIESMNSKTNSVEERVKLPPTDSISRCYQPQQGNRKLIRILTVIVYVLCVSLAAIMLSLYYIFIWDPTIRPFVTKTGPCEKLIIPEKIAIRLLNSSEVTAEQFYKHILEQYRILYQLQQQRQQFLQKQHIQLQKLAAGNRFQEIFATATIIQAHERPLKPITATNGTFLMDTSTSLKSQQHKLQPHVATIQRDIVANEMPPILDMQQTIKSHGRRKTHRKHNNSLNNNNNNSNNNSNSHRTHRRNLHKYHNKIYNMNDNNKNNNHAVDTYHNALMRPALNEPILVEGTPATLFLSETYTSMPIPLILNSSEDKDRLYNEQRSNAPVGKRRATTPTYFNPLLTGELIFEK